MLSGISNNTSQPSFNALYIPTKSQIARIAGQNVANGAYSVKTELKELAKNADVHVIPFSTPEKPNKNGLWVSVNNITNNSVVKKWIKFKNRIRAKYDSNNMSPDASDFMVAGTHYLYGEPSESKVARDLLYAVKRNVTLFLESKKPSYYKSSIKYYN